MSAAGSGSDGAGLVCPDRVELMDYLDSIDCSLEDFQAMLYEKQFGIDFDSLEVTRLF